MISPDLRTSLIRADDARGAVALLEMLSRARDSFMPGSLRGEDVRLPTECPSLDVLLGGGVESGALTEFFGEAGTGKTNVCLQLARNVARDGGKVLYVDTEGVSLERLGQIAGPDARKVQQAILFFEPFSLREQEAVLEKVVRLASSAPEVGLVVVDSATLHYRVALGAGDGVRDRRSLSAQMSNLASLARRRDLPVVITNQVYTNVETELLEPVGGHLLRHISKAAIRLDKAGAGRRKRRSTRLRSRPTAMGGVPTSTSLGCRAPQ